MMSQSLCLVQRLEQLDGVEQVVHVDSCPFIWQARGEPHNAPSCWSKLKVLEFRSQIWRRTMTKPKRVHVPTVAKCIALKTISLSLVGNSKLHRRRSLEANRLFVDGYPLARNPHVLALLVQLVDELPNLPQWIGLLLLTRTVPVV